MRYDYHNKRLVIAIIELIITPKKFLGNGFHNSKVNENVTGTESNAVF